MKARLIEVQLQLDIVADNGDTLQRISIKPAVVPAHLIDAIPQAIRDALAQVQQQLDAQTTPPPGA
jgi:hypothetical protein